MKSTKKSLLLSTISLVLCFAMLLGTTWAWFTDEVTSGVNTIKAGNLDIEVTHSNAKVAASENKSIAGETTMFPDKDGNAMLWEPGAMSYENFTVSNVGTLALKYNMSMNIVDFNKLGEHNLTEVLKVKVLTGDAIKASLDRATVAAMDWTGAQSLDAFRKDGGMLYPSTDTTVEHASEEKFQVIVYWQPTENDNLWNANNGQQTSDGQPLFVNFGVNVIATQLEHEFDSFDNNYDANATLPPLPERLNGSAKSGGIRKSTETGKVTVTGEGGATGDATDAVEIKIEKDVSGASEKKTVADATVPAAAAIKVMDAMFTEGKVGAAGSTEAGETTDDVLTMTLKVETKEAVPAAIKLDVSMLAEAVRTVTKGEGATVVRTQTVTENVTELTQPVKVVLLLDPGLEDVKVTHTHGNEAPVSFTRIEGDGKTAADVTADGTFFYDKADGKLTLLTNKFSEFAITFTRPEVCRIGNTPYGSVEEAVAAASDGATIVLLEDVTDATINANITITSNGCGLTATVAEGKTLTVKDGTFPTFAITGEGNCVVTGGTFGTDPSAYVAPGRQAVKSEDESVWTVQKADAKYVAQIGSNFYENFADAATVISSATAGENVVVYIIGNCSCTSEVLFKCNLTVEVLDGVTFSANNLPNGVFKVNDYYNSMTLCGVGKVELNGCKFINTNNRDNLITIKDITINGTGTNTLVWVGSYCPVIVSNAKIKGCSTLFGGALNNNQVVENGYFDTNIEQYVPCYKELFTLTESDPLYAVGYRYTTKDLPTDKAVAYIERNGNKVYFSDVFGAVNMAEENETVVLMKDMTISMAKSFGNTVPVTLDLGQKNVTTTGTLSVGSKTITIKNGTITASSGNAFSLGTTSKIVLENLNVTAGSYVFKCDAVTKMFNQYFKPSGSIVVKSGTYSGTLGIFDSNVNGPQDKEGYAYNVSLEGGTFDVPTNYVDTLKGFVTTGCTVTINGESYTAP